MGSRALVVICKDADSAKARFGVVDGGIGKIYTRTGRAFIKDDTLEHQMLERVQTAITESRLWDELETSWLLLDCELMPWSAKAQQLIRDQYAAVGAAGTASLSEVVSVMQSATHLGEAITPLLESYQQKQTQVAQYIEAYQHYCWEIKSLDDYKLAPFHLLASEGAVHVDKSHQWHVETLDRIAQHDTKLLLPTNRLIVDVTDEAQIRDGIDWWLELTEKGGEGYVVKPLDFIVRGRNGASCNRLSKCVDVSI